MLGLVSTPYAAAMRVRNRMWDRRQPTKLACPTISIGNLTAGGTGKTPTVAWLARRLLDAGERPAVLLRGYKAEPGQRGDEEQLLVDLLGDAVPVEANPDRVAGAQAVLTRRHDVSVLLLDDGFQHRRVAREVDLVLVDATQPDGLSHVLPRGYLREPFDGISRATAVLLTRCDHGDADAAETLVRRHFDGPVHRSHFRLDVDTSGRAIAACGIGNPEAFFQGLRAIGVDLVKTMPFGDHHPFDADDARTIAAAVPSGGSAIVTGKDWTKLRHHWPKDVPIAVARQELVIDRADAFFDAIRPAKAKSSTPAVVTMTDTHIE